MPLTLTLLLHPERHCTGVTNAVALLLVITLIVPGGQISVPAPADVVNVPTPVTGWVPGGQINVPAMGDVLTARGAVNAEVMFTFKAPF